MNDLLQRPMSSKAELELFFALSVLNHSNADNYFFGIQSIKQKISLMSYGDIMKLLFTEVRFIILIIFIFRIGM